MKKRLKNFFYQLQKNATILGVIGAIILGIVLICLCVDKGGKIGVVDMSKVYANAQVFQAIRSEQTTVEDEWKAQALAQKQELEAADKALSKKKARMRKAKFDKEVAVLKARILDFQNQQMAKLDLIRYQAGQITSRVEEVMKPMIAMVAQEKKLVFVLSASNVLYHSKAVDITSDVIEQLDTAFQAGQLPDLQISLSEGE